tara:strand:+ start:349 stop:516 length:168 start_codon:yes stop_codon:yes gene_type:complete
MVTKLEELIATVQSTERSKCELLCLQTAQSFRDSDKDGAFAAEKCAENITNMEVE